MKIELHCHTKESSLCGRVSAVEVIKLHKKAGYDGIVITDHFNLDNLNAFSGSAQKKAKSWRRGYEEAVEAGKQYDMVVLFGLEARLIENDNDYLIFGAMPDFVERHAQLCKYSLGKLHDVCQEEQLLLIQAHPFRPGCFPVDAKYLDGVEVKNCNQWHDSHNDLAKEFAEKHPELIQTAGSDFHQLEDLDGAPIDTDTWIANERELYKVLKERRFIFV